MSRSEIKIRDITNQGVEQCRELCNELMKFQADCSMIGTEILAAMNFENRLKPSFENAQFKKLLAAFNGGEPVAYVYAEVADICEEDRFFVPDWAKTVYRKGHLIFYPPEQKLPARIGTFNNIYIKPAHKGRGLGKLLSERVMSWMTSIENTQAIYVYVSNGNEQVAGFYRQFGFVFSHEVLGGLIKAYRQEI